MNVGAPASAANAEKETVIRDLVRQAPSPELVDKVVEALSAYPLEALKRVQAFGTKIEIYDFFTGQDQVPNYLESLAQANSLGAYNSKANVLGVDKSDLAPYVLLHEFAHALDASLGEVSELPAWKGAHRNACHLNQFVKTYAKFHPSEYLAENTAAYLIPDDAHVPMLDDCWTKGLAVNDLDEREYYRENQDFYNGRLQRLDPDAYRMVDEMLGSLGERPAPTARPAMNQEQWAEFLATEKKG